MSKMSRDKGKRGELEARDLLRKHGFQARRGVQRTGGPGASDLEHNIPYLHIEVKRAEALSLYTAMEQADDDRGWLDTPLILHRRNSKPWLAILPADVFLEMLAVLIPPEQRTQLEGYDAESN